MDKVLMVIVFFVVQQQFENHRSSRGSWGGIVGALLPVPTAAILQVLPIELAALKDAD